MHGAACEGVLCSHKPFKKRRRYHTNSTSTMTHISVELAASSYEVVVPFFVKNTNTVSEKILSIAFSFAALSADSYCFFASM